MVTRTSRVTSAATWFWWTGACSWCASVLPGDGGFVGLFVRSDAVDPHIDQLKMDAIERLGGHSYSRARDQFDIRTQSVDEWTGSAAGDETGYPGVRWRRS